MTTPPNKGIATTEQQPLPAEFVLPQLTKFEALGVMSPIPMILGLLFWARTRHSKTSKEVARDHHERGIMDDLKERADDAEASEKEARKSERAAWVQSSEYMARVAGLETQNNYQAKDIERLQKEGSDLRAQATDLRNEIAVLRRELRDVKRSVNESGFGGGEK